MITAVVIFAITYIFIATEKVDKTIAAMLGAAAVIFAGQIEYTEALRKIDLNVIYLLVGMMIIVHILATTGIFEWIAVSVAQRAGGRSLPLLVLLLIVTAVLSAFLDNVTTVILIAPITILITQILEVPTVPFLILEAVFSNIGGTATLVGDPPNVLIGSQTHLVFNDFLFHLGPVVLIIGAISLPLVILVLRKSLIVSDAARARIMEAQPERAITHPGRLVVALFVFGLVLAGFFLSQSIGIEPGLVAIAGAFLMTLFCGMKPHDVLADVEWGTIFFFLGLFMLIGALEHVGVFEYLGQEILRLTQGNLLWTCIAILWFSAIFSALVDNIPLVMAMIPLIRSISPLFLNQLGLEPDTEQAHMLVTEPLYWCLALGACLGGNGSLVGASANVVIAQIARKNKYKLSFWDFTRYGLPLMFISLLISTLYVYLRYFVYCDARS